MTKIKIHSLTQPFPRLASLVSTIITIARIQSAILIKNLPETIEEEDIYRTLSSYGDVKKINEQVADDVDSTASFLVKFYDLQDSKQVRMDKN